MKPKDLSFDPQLGHQNSLFRLLVNARRAGVPISEAPRVVDVWLQQYRPQMTRDFTSPEIARQMSRAYQLTTTPGVPRRRGRPPLSPPPPQAEFCPALSAHVDALMNGFTVAELQQESPGNCGAPQRTLWNGERLVDYPKPFYFLAPLYYRAGVEGDPWICYGEHKFSTTTVSFDEFAKLKHSIQFVVPNPMRAATGKTQCGKVSGRTKDNACLPSERLFSVVEFDNCPSHDIQAGKLRWLGLNMPLVMVVDSAGKSLQGWFYIKDHLDTLPEFETLAIMLGADPQPLKTTAQFVRAPWGVRRNPSDSANGKYQRVVYFNPFAIKAKGGLK